MSFIVSAPSSGSGKTTITLGLLRALSRTQPIRAAKSGPDYIDPRFHEAACGRPCVNLDAWAMTPDRIKSLAHGDTPLIIEGAMGLFDGAPPEGKGATADLARILRLPVVLVIDAGKMAGSVAPLVHGFMNFDPSVQIAGIILNNVGSPRHEKMLRHALGDIKVYGVVPRTRDLTQPSRHLGLVQAQERPDLERYLDDAADLITRSVDLDALMALDARPLAARPTCNLQPPAQSIAIAQDEAFAFTYPHVLNDWRTKGATLSFFSPLNNDPVPTADFVYLPGGYPELHAGRLASNLTFLDSLRGIKAPIFGECGGYMILGDGLIDADGERHEMAGLLRLETSFAQRKLHLGYRHVTATHGPMAGSWTGHEFHYASTLRAEGTPLFNARDAEGHDLGAAGLINGKVSGSFFHLIDAS
ncbi:cobyrinate a,c-diamide synthase [Loktanella sp. S4079]|uniref:cobyrinate a,c-diamide synthase n=1 Tax=Loktanella sp. S4079 TaxID=579483 RepID=UPI0005FA518E|nr:cobyrinate a,c-diamide synthase [Loktanella sp. S4079]KJZ20007.1 cobyrinic acid a,c-diamide synthase [Loktanella sp. S4079]